MLLSNYSHQYSHHTGQKLQKNRTNDGTDHWYVYQHEAKGHCSLTSFTSWDWRWLHIYDLQRKRETTRRTSKTPKLIGFEKHNSSHSTIAASSFFSSLTPPKKFSLKNKILSICTVLLNIYWHCNGQACSRFGVQQEEHKKPQAQIPRAFCTEIRPSALFIQKRGVFNGLPGFALCNSFFLRRGTDGGK